MQVRWYGQSMILAMPHRKRIGGDTMEKRATITIEGMSCEHCVRAVKEAIGALNGVKSVDVSLEDEKRPGCV